MEKLELTPAEVMSVLNWKKSKVYYWINSNKFETIERETGKNVLITNEQINRLKSKAVEESLKQFEDSSIYSENVQDDLNENITKHYETVLNNSKTSEQNFYLESLNTIKAIHQSSISNFNYSMKLLTDGKNELENAYFELKAQNKEISEKLEQSKVYYEENIEQTRNNFNEKLENSKEKILELTNRNNLKNYIIAALIFLIVCLCGFVLMENFKLFEKEQKEEFLNKIEQNQTLPENSTQNHEDLKINRKIK